MNSASWLLSEQAARMVSTLLVGIIIARHLGPEGLGQISYAWSIVGIFGVFVSLGLEGVVIKELVHHPAQRDELLGTAFYLMLIAGLIIAVFLSGLSSLVTHSGAERWLIILAAATLPLQAAGVVSYEKQSRASLGKVTRAQLLQVVFSTLLRAGLVALGCSVVAFGAAGVADAALLATLLLTIAIQDGLSPRKWVFKWELAKRLLKQSWPLIFTALLVTVFVKIDQIMLRYLMDVKAVGEYAIAVRLTSVLVIIPMMVIKAVNPAIIAAQKGDQALYESRLQLLYDLGVILSVAAALAFTFLAGPLIHLLFGPQFAGATGVAVIFVWCSVWITVGQINAITIIAAGRTYQTLIKALIGVVTNVILNFLLIRNYDIEGAAIATLISYIVSSYILMLLFPDQRRQFRFVSRSLIVPLSAHRVFQFANQYRQKSK
jgi:O-antigen/teichoic acid export membrane protein